MKRLAGFLCALAALPAWGQARGYAFDEPELFARQLAWGVVHGVRLLGRACFERGDAVASAAYADWLDREKATILATERALARRYFDRDTASPDALAAVLNLRPSLETPAAELAAACATLPEALAAPRYRLDRFIEEKEREGMR